MYNPCSVNAKSNDKLWQVAFGCFMLAGVTGFLYRLGMIGWLPHDLTLSLQNIRHAHSHLMFFGWAAPLPLYIFYKIIATQEVHTAHGNILRFMRSALWSCLLLGLLSFPSFLMFGYHPVCLGFTSLPVSVILSGLVMISWYLFMAGYLILKKRTSLNSNSWMEASLLMLFVCSLGAWGVAIVHAIAPAEQLFMKALTHFFLATFTEGWVLLAILTVLAGDLEASKAGLRGSEGVLIAMIAIGAPLTFPYGISETMLTPLLLNTARVGGLLISAALLFIIYRLFSVNRRYDSIWTWITGFLLLKAVMQLLATFLPADFWLADHSLRILYLHILLLGALTLCVVGWLHRRSPVPLTSFNLLASSIAVVLGSLVLLTRFWPPALSGMWIYYLVAGAALLPVIALGTEWWQLAVSTRNDYTPQDNHN